MRSIQKSYQEITVDRYCTLVQYGRGKTVLGFFPPRVEAHETSNQHSQEQLSANSLDDG